MEHVNKEVASVHSEGDPFDVVNETLEESQLNSKPWNGKMHFKTIYLYILTPINVGHLDIRTKMFDFQPLAGSPRVFASQPIRRRILRRVYITKNVWPLWREYRRDVDFNNRFRSMCHGGQFTSCNFRKEHQRKVYDCYHNISKVYSRTHQSLSLHLLLVVSLECFPITWREICWRGVWILLSISHHITQYHNISHHITP